MITKKAKIIICFVSAAVLVGSAIWAVRELKTRQNAEPFLAGMFVMSNVLVLGRAVSVLRKGDQHDPS
jgi:hypothetical protein